MPLRLVHVSDIHFSGYGSGWDLDADQRAQLLRDVRQLVTDGGTIDGILVGGDIAFRASVEEYEKAALWLDELRAACGGLDTGRVWTVPGNHDVDRATIAASPVLQEFRETVRDCSLANLDVTLSERLAKDPTAESLLMPLRAYNEFAAKYTCSVTSDAPHWFDESLEIDGLKVRFLGLNSVLISDGRDSDQVERSKLVLGMYQCQIPTDEGTVHVVIAHHPPSWIRDWETVEPYLRRAHLLLFGHEHAFRARQTHEMGSVEVFAGAVGPDRDDGPPAGDYAPTFNVITLAKAAGDTLKVIVEPRCWDLEQAAFSGHPEGITQYSVAISQAPQASAADSFVEMGDPSQARPANPLSSTSPVTTTSRIESLPVETPSELRRIGTEYMRRTWTDRVDIARRLGVLTDEDLQTSPLQLFPLILARIRERTLVTNLIEELDRG